MKIDKNAKKYGIGLSEQGVFIDEKNCNIFGASVQEDFGNGYCLFSNFNAGSCINLFEFFDTLAEAVAFIKENPLDDIIVNVSKGELSTNYWQQYRLFQKVDDYDDGTEYDIAEEFEEDDLYFYSNDDITFAKFVYEYEDEEE